MGQSEKKEMYLIFLIPLLPQTSLQFSKVMIIKLQLYSSHVNDKKSNQEHGAANAPVLAPALQVTTQNVFVMLRETYAQHAYQACGAPTDHHQQKQGLHKQLKTQ